MACYFEYSPADLFRYRAKLSVLMKRVNLDCFAYGCYCHLSSPYTTIFVLQYVPSAVFEEAFKLGLSVSVFSNAASYCGVSPYQSVEVWVSPHHTEFDAIWHFDQ